MKVLAGIFLALLAVIYFLPAFMSRSDEIDGTSREAVYKSAIKVKRYLNTDERVLFDTALGILDKIKAEEGPDAFVDSVDGKNPDEIVETAKQEVNFKIAAGHPDFKQYSSWDDMIQKLTSGNGRKPSVRSNPSPDHSLRNSERPARPQ
jgi:sensor domain CHASE-containing protein